MNPFALDPALEPQRELLRKYAPDRMLKADAEVMSRRCLAMGKALAAHRDKFIAEVFKCAS